MGKFIITEEEKNSIRNMYLTEQVGPNAGEIQKFLQTNQDNTIVVDYKFGPKTATAVAKYILRAYPSSTKYSNVTTVQQLWQALKDNGNDVGEKPGFGPKMAGAVSRVLNAAKTAINAAKKVVTTTTTVGQSKTVYQPYQNLYTPGKI